MSNIIRNNIAKRLGGKDFGTSTELYKFAKIKLAKKEALEKNPQREIIDMGVGEPDWNADKIVLDRLNSESRKIENRFYADNGITEFKEACITYMKNVYKVDDLKENNVMHGIGSKQILSMIPVCFINPGDYSLVTSPGYPIISTHTKYLGGDVFYLPLVKERQFFPDLSSIPDDIIYKAKLLYINYPNNPTGQVATEEFYTQIIEFASENDIVVVSDAAYSALVFDRAPLSIFSIDGARDVAVEVHSLSKSFNMTGWRIAFIIGNEDAIELYGTVKDNTDSGQFRAIQLAACTALENSDITQKTVEKYSRRFDLLVGALKEIGFQAEKPKGTFYCYVPIPKGTANGVVFSNAEQVADFFIKEAGVSTVPWDDAGSYLRFSVAFEASPENEIDLISEMKSRLLKLRLVF